MDRPGSFDPKFPTKMLLYKATLEHLMMGLEIQFMALDYESGLILFESLTCKRDTIGMHYAVVCEIDFKTKSISAQATIKEIDNIIESGDDAIIG